jgi:NADH-quinone oxidoreductase subunit L
MTHAFFKALLFLAAGIVIHAIVNEQDIRKLSGVGKLMPFTRAVFVAGSLALVGIFPFAGFFSKDEIISACLAHGGWYGYVLYVVALLGALLTGIYTFRLFFIVFLGEPSAFAGEHFHRHHGHEGPFWMLVPVGVLGVLSVVGGWIQWAPLWTPINKWLEPVAAPLVEPTNTQAWVTSALAMAIGLVGIGIAYGAYVAKRIPVPSSPAVLEHKFYWDELYDAVFYRPSAWLARVLGDVIERPLIGGSISAVGETFGFSSRELSLAQTGLVRTYALALAGGIAILAVVFLSVR